MSIFIVYYFKKKTIVFMRRNYQYILFALLIFIVYEVYLIFSFKYVDIQKDLLITNTHKKISLEKMRLEEKKAYFAYVNTLSYKDKVAKQSQNKKNPWENVVFIVSKEEMEQYKKIDIQGEILKEREPKWPTYGMSNHQKWVYVLLKIDLRD